MLRPEAPLYNKPPNNSRRPYTLKYHNPSSKSQEALKPWGSFRACARRRRRGSLGLPMSWYLLGPTRLKVWGLIAHAVRIRSLGSLGFRVENTPQVGRRKSGSKVAGLGSKREILHLTRSPTPHTLKPRAHIPKARNVQHLPEDSPVALQSPD